MGFPTATTPGILDHQTASRSPIVGRPARSCSTRRLPPQLRVGRSELARLIPADAISANPSHGRKIILPEMFDELYARLGIEPPTERMRDFHLTLDMSEEEADAATASSKLVPTYNTGVIHAPKGSPLLALWQEHLRVLGGSGEAGSR